MACSGTALLSQTLCILVLGRKSETDRILLILKIEDKISVHLKQTYSSYSNVMVKKERENTADPVNFLLT
jgi:hypothetical protein